MPRAKHRPRRHSIWPTRRDLTGCYVTVDPEDEERILLAFPSSRDDTYGRQGVVYGGISVDRREARMLAKRINECLDGTRKP